MDIRKKKKGFLLTVLTAAIAVYSMTFVGFVDAYAAEKESSLFPLGMSQNTANKMSKKGKTYEEILQFFFAGTEIKEVAEILLDTE